MLVLELDGELFRFRAKTPALEVLFQLPPRWKARTAVLCGATPRAARQMIAPFGDYASGEADKSAKTDLSAPPKIIENVKIKMKNYCIILNYKILKFKCRWRGLTPAITQGIDPKIKQGPLQGSNPRISEG